MNPTPPILDSPLYEPTYINLEYFFYKILQISEAIGRFLTSIFGGGDRAGDGAARHGSSTWDVIVFILAIIAILFIAVIIYTLVRILEVQKKHMEELEAEVAHFAAASEEEIKPEISRWDQILEHTASVNPNDWRLAIIEADTMLDDLLREKDFMGDTLGERLTNASPGDFVTLNQAWEAHKVRNRIAHEGTDYQIDQPEVRRVIGLYEKVFREFDYI